MRLNIVFVSLLALAATATSIAWRAAGAAINGEPLARLSMTVAALAGLASFALLARIIERVTRRKVRETGAAATAPSLDSGSGGAAALAPSTERDVFITPPGGRDRGPVPAEDIARQ